MFSVHSTFYEPFKKPYLAVAWIWGLFAHLLRADQVTNPQVAILMITNENMDQFKLDQPEFWSSCSRGLLIVVTSVANSKYKVQNLHN